MTVLWSPQAADDYLQALSWLHERSQSASTRLRRRIEAALVLLAGGIAEGAEVTLATGEWVRSWPIPPYRLYYQRIDDGLPVLRLYHQHREPIAR